MTKEELQQTDEQKVAAYLNSMLHVLTILVMIPLAYATENTSLAQIELSISAGYYLADVVYYCYFESDALFLFHHSIMIILDLAVFISQEPYFGSDQWWLYFQALFIIESTNFGIAFTKIGISKENKTLFFLGGVSNLVYYPLIRLVYGIYLMVVINLDDDVRSKFKLSYYISQVALSLIILMSFSFYFLKILPKGSENLFLRQYGKDKNMKQLMLNGEGSKAS